MAARLDLGVVSACLLDTPSFRGAVAGCRTLASRAATARGFRGRRDKKFKMRPGPKDPQLKDVLRRFMKKVHPDLFHKYVRPPSWVLVPCANLLTSPCVAVPVRLPVCLLQPDLKTTNEESVQRLLSLLQAVKSGENDDFVEARSETLEFYARTATADHFQRIKCQLRVAGNNSPHVLAEGLSSLFKSVDLPPVFHWGGDYWDRKVVFKAPPTEEDDDSAA